MKYIEIVQNDAGVLLLLFFGALLPSYVPVMSVFRIAIAALKSHINQITLSYAMVLSYLVTSSAKC